MRSIVNKIALGLAVILLLSMIGCARQGGDVSSSGGISESSYVSGSESSSEGASSEAVSSSESSSSQSSSPVSSASSSSVSSSGAGSSSAVSSSTSPSSSESDASPISLDPFYNGWTLVWSDEFDGPQIDKSVWTFEQGYCRNNELQNYTDSANNAYIEDGKLVIKTFKEQSYASNIKQWMNFSSASLNTQGKKFFTYGKFEIRAKLPYGPGIWPAFWMCGEYGEWPDNGEIDIMEFWGGPESDNVIYSNVHYVRNGSLTSWGGKSRFLPSGRFADDFHIIGLEWDENALRFYVDGEVHNTFYLDTQNLKTIFSKPFFLWINTAVNPYRPEWGWGDANLNTYPQDYIIDYVRVYQKI